jgi:hypothetical protein
MNPLVSMINHHASTKPPHVAVTLEGHVPQGVGVQVPPSAHSRAAWVSMRRPVYGATREVYNIRRMVRFSGG